MTGTCALCSKVFETAQPHRRFCSSRCRDRHRDQRVIEWRVCETCGYIYGQTGQAERKGREVAHGCRYIHQNTKPFCTTCWVFKEPGHSQDVEHRRASAIAWYQANRRREPRPITCKQCAEVFVGKWVTLCPACVRANHREGKRRQHRIRRARLASVLVVPYRSGDIFERDGYRCHLCGRMTRRDAVVPHPKAPTIDHLVPISAGGADAPLNVATAHFECNWRRSDGGVAQLRLVA